MRPSPVSEFDIRLREVRVVSIHFQVLQRPGSEFDTNVTFDIKPSSLGAQTDTSFEVLLTLKIGFSSSRRKAPPFDAEFAMCGLYEHKRGLPADLREYFVNINGPIMLWPYMRELVTSITTRAGYPPLVLTTLDVAKLTAASGLGEAERQRQR